MITKDNRSSMQQMHIVEEYEKVLAYLYPIAQSMPRKHGVAREMFLRCMLDQVDLFIVAGKSNQISKLYAADAGLSMLRFWIRFLRHSIRHMTPKQEHHAQALIASPGSILGRWMKSKKG